MIVVAIMGSMAAMIAPGLAEFMADIRASGASEDMVRLSRHMRARVQETGLAHLLMFSGEDNVNGGLGVILVYEGMNNHCRETPWQQAITGAALNPDPNGHAIVDRVDLANPAYNVPPAGATTPRKDDSRRQVIAMAVRGNFAGGKSAIICYEPGGGTYEGVADVAAGNFAFTPQSQAITFTITRSVSGEQRGPTREIVFPVGGAARFRF